MASENIAKEIGTLVDHLRAGDDQKISLTDVAAATEVLLQATRMYFRNIDTSILKQVQTMSDLIVAMRRDIAQLRPEDLKDEKIPRAGLELDAVVQNTEDATNTIMEAAEEIMSADLSDLDATPEIINNSCMRIFEACSFQDITGQRVSKVVKTLSHIEDRLEAMRGDWANELGTGNFEDSSADESGDTRPDADLLNGPALGGEGVDQSGVDALMNDDLPSEGPEVTETEQTGQQEAVAAKGPEETEPEPEAPKAEDKTPEEVAPEPEIEVTEPKAEAIEPKPEPEVASKTAEKPSIEEKPETAEKDKVLEAAGDEEDDEGETNSQADIDALFD